MFALHNHCTRFTLRGTVARKTLNWMLYFIIVISPKELILEKVLQIPANIFSMVVCSLAYVIKMNKNNVFFLTYFLFFQLFIHPPLGLDHYNLGLPLRVARLLLCDVITCMAHFFRFV